MHEHASLNRIFRLVWNAATSTWVAVHEHARGRSKAGRGRTRSLRAVFMASALSAGLATAYAAPPKADVGTPPNRIGAQAVAMGTSGLPAVGVNTTPQGGTVVAGQAQIQTSGANLTVTQTTARTAIDWLSFDIGSNASVVFRQPDAQSVALNRVIGGQPSQIFGRLSSNGQVFLSNANGVYFSPNASVDVGALVATTHSISNADFMAGNWQFHRDGSTAAVVNEGQLTAAQGGYIALLAPEVRNSGVVVAQAGTVALAAGEMIELQFEGGSLAKLRVTPAEVATLIENRHAVLAPGGQILMSARAALSLQGGVINNSGELSASSLQAKGGRIVLEGDQVTLAAGSLLDVSGATGGGSVNVGGNWQGQGPLHNATRTVVAQGATIKADATVQGDGGTVVVWANDRTDFNGFISARGGAAGGNGGAVETSGKATLMVRTGVADVGAAQGKGGIWLLDPHDLTIGNVSDFAIGGTFGTTADDSLLSVTSLNAALTSGSNVIVLTNDGGIGRGDITVNGAIVASPLTTGQSASLTLAAQGDINFLTGGSISAGGADRSLNVNLLAGTSLAGGTSLAQLTAAAGTQASEISMASGTSINTGQGGNLTAIARRDITLADLSLGTGNLSITSTLNGAIGQSGAAVVGGTTSISAGSGEVALNNAANQLTGAISSSGTGEVTVRNTVATTLGAIGSAGGAAVGLDVTTGNQALTQSAAAFVSGEATFRAGTGALTLSNAGNQFSGAINSTGTGAFTLANDVATNLRTIGAAGVGNAAASVAVTTSNDAVTQSGAAYVAGTTSVNAGSASVTLTNLGNQLAGAISSVGSGALTLRNATATTLGAIGAAGAGNAAASLDVRTATGDITQTAAAYVAGSSLLRSDTGGAINLGQAGNQLAGAITTVGSGAVTLANDVATTLGQIGSSGIRAASLTVSTTNDAITQTGAANVDGTTTLAAGTGAVTLDNANNKLGGAVSSSGTGAVVLNNTQATVLGTIGAAGAGNAAASLAVTTVNDAVTQTGAAFVVGTTSVSAGSADVTLTNAGNQLAGAFSAPGRGNVSLTNTVATVLGAIGASGVGNAASSLTVNTSNNAVSQTAAAFVDGATTVGAGSGAVDLGNSANSLTGAVAVTTTGSANVVSASNLGVTFTGSAATSATATGTLTSTLVGTGATALNGAGVTTSGSSASLSSTSSGTTSLGATTVTGDISLNSAGAVTQSGAISASGLELLGAGGVTLTNAANNVARIAAGTGAGAITYVDADALAVDTVNTVGISRTGTVNLSTLGGDLTLNQSVATTSTAADAVTLNASSATAAGTGAGGNIVLPGAATVTVGAGGRATLYSGTVAGSTGVTALVGSGSGRFRYGSDEGASNFTAALGAGVNAVYRETPTVTITADNLTRTYGTAVGATTSLSGNVNGDTAGQIFSTAPTVTVAGPFSTSGNATVGAHNLTPGGGVDALGYTLAYAAPGTLTVNAATISAITGITAANRVYDTTTNATLNTGSAAFTGIVSGDVLTLGAAPTGAFLDKNAGTGKTVNITGLSLGGADAGNYILASTTASTTADITPATISAITGLTAANKVYDGNTTATLGGTAAFTGILGGDTLTVATSTGNFSDKNAAVGKTVNITGLTLGGTDAGNYTLASSTASTTADITPKDITGVTGITAANKVYDATTAATLTTTAAGFTGIVTGDSLNVATATGTFVDKNAGTAKTVNITGLTLGGTDAGNYNLTTTTAATTADITAATIAAITGITAANKTYNGNTTAALTTTGAGFTGIQGSDNLTVATSTGNFSDKNAAVGKTVNITGLTLGGVDAGNYVLASTTASTTADIAKADIANVTGITAANKVYNANTVATLNTGSAVFTGMVSGDNLTVATSTGAFADKNIGTAKAVSITGITLGGIDANNYNLLSSTAATTADITAATISAITGITAANKVYDTTTAATLTTTGAGFTGIQGADTLTVATSTGNFLDKNVGTAKTVNITGLTLGGADAGNYILASPTATTTADITPATISAITGLTAANKVYDGNTTATLGGTAAFTGILGGDTLTVATSTGNFNNKNVGTGKAVAITGLSLGGTDAGNYTLASTTASTTADITPATIAGITGITAANKVYDATTAATLTTTGASFTGMVAGDVLNVATSTGAFVDKNAGLGKTVNITGLSLGGTDAGNYTLASTIASTTANIAQAQLAAITGITAANKVYDATTTATLSTGAAGFTGIVAGDVLTVAAATGNFSDKNAGTGKTVNITGLALGGADAGNYALPTGATTTTADITKADIANVTGITAANKVYNGNTVATLATGAAGFTGMLGGDNLTVATSTGTFADKNVGTAKAVSITGITLGGTDAGNYNLVSNTAATTADITAATISAITGITAANKTYDTTTAATLTTTAAGFTGMVAGDVLNVATSTGNFVDKNAGTGKTVNITGLSLGGTDAGNYTLASTTATTTANIDRAAVSAITGITAGNKVYNGNTTAALNTGAAVFNGILGADNLTVATSTGNFSDKNVGTAKAVAITGLSLGGTDAGNYTLASTTAATTADITPATIAAITGITAANKTYDTTTAATLTTTAAGFTGMVAGDVLNVATSTGNFADKNAGTGKTVNITGLSLGGTDAGNYTLASSTATTTANIARANLTAITGITAADKVYDGNSTATVNTTASAITGILGTDVVNVASATGTFANKNAAVGKVVTIGVTLGGTDAGNYNLPTTTTTATITPATLSSVGGITAFSKIEDGSTVASLATGGAVFNGMVAGDQLQVGAASGAFNNAQAGLGKPVAITGITVVGTDAGNYTLASNTATTTANIYGRAVVLPQAPLVVLPQRKDDSEVQLNTSHPELVAGAPTTLAAVAAAAAANEVMVRVVREPSALRGGATTVEVPKAQVASGFSFQLPFGLRSAIRASGGAPTVILADGRPLPSWLRFDVANLSFTASGVPIGGLPLRLSISLGGGQTSELLIEAV